MTTQLSRKEDLKEREREREREREKEKAADTSVRDGCDSAALEEERERERERRVGGGRRRQAARYGRSVATEFYLQRAGNLCGLELAAELFRSRPPSTAA